MTTQRPKILPSKRWCPYCKERATSYPPDGVDYCTHCEICIEGQTLLEEPKEE